MIEDDGLRNLVGKMSSVRLMVTVDPVLPESSGMPGFGDGRYCFYTWGDAETKLVKIANN